MEAVEDKSNQKPEYLTEKFFSGILRKEFGQCNIDNLSVANVLATGENYATAIQKVTIDFTNKDGAKKQVSYFVKKDNEGMAGMMANKMQLFNKEEEMYSVVIPKFEALFAAAGEKVKFGCKCLKATTNPNYIILEDLKVKNFKNSPRQTGLDLDHSKAVLDKIAQFHAASACLHAKEGPYKPLLTKSILSEDNVAMFEVMLNSMLPILLDSIDSWEGCEKYKEKIKTIMPGGIQLLQKAEETYLNDFNVLNHGDLWSNNIMFHYDEAGSIDDMCLVDFQMCKWGSPVQDLQYFIFSSCSQEVRVKEFDHMISYYHGQLIKYLNLLKYPKKLPKLTDLHVQLLKKGFYGVYIAFTMLSATLFDPTEQASMEAFLQETDAAIAFKKKLYTNPRYVKAMQSLLPFFDNRGLLDL